jgi:hypothetical protein
MKASRRQVVKAAIIIHQERMLLYQRSYAKREVKHDALDKKHVELSCVSTRGGDIYFTRGEGRAIYANPISKMHVKSLSW